jgi:hypothetical protein
MRELEAIHEQACILFESKERQRHPSGVLHIDEDIAVYPVMRNSFIGENL